MSNATSNTSGSVVSEWSRLAEMRKAGDVDGLLRELKNPRMEEAGGGLQFTVRERAIAQLTRIGDPRAGEAITGLLDDPLPSVRADAARALGRLDHPAAESRLIDLLQDESDSVRMCAAKSLGKIGSGPAITGLIPILQDQNPWVRMAAAKSLAKIGDDSAVEPLRNAFREERIRHPTFLLRLGSSFLRLKVRQMLKR